MNDQAGGLAKRVAVISGVAVVVLLGATAYLITRDGGGNPEPLTTPTTRPTTQPTTAQPSSDVPTASDATPVGDDAPELTETQKRAAADARYRIDFDPYSRAKLIARLSRPSEYFEQYSVADATIAVDSLGIDWDYQAKLRAEFTLESRAISKPGLFDSLTMGPEGFTDEQATAAVETVDVDWSAQPERYAREREEYGSWSRWGIVQSMTADGFTEAEAEQGVDDANIDFNKEAAEAAEKQLERDPTLTCDELIESLTDKLSARFTVGEATYGAGTTQTCINPEPPVTTTTHVPVSPGDWTPTQHEAYEDAKPILVKRPMSRAGLIEELVDEYHHSDEDATIVVDSLKLNWGSQAVERALRLVFLWPYSEKGVNKALQSDAYLFSEEQAMFALDRIEVDWDAEAVEMAELLLERTDDLTCEAAIESLTVYEYFTPEQAQHGADEAGIC